MYTSMKILGFLSYATSKSTFNRFDRVSKLVRMWNTMLDLLSSFSNAKYSKDNVKYHMGLVHPDCRALFLKDAFTTMVGRKAADHNIKNLHRLGSFQTKYVFTECVVFLTGLEILSSVINANFWRSNTTPESFVEVPIWNTFGRQEGAVFPSETCFQPNDGFTRNALRRRVGIYHHVRRIDE